MRLEMLEEAIEVIRGLWEGGQYSHYGVHYAVENARIYTLPDTPPDILVSGFGPEGGRPGRAHRRRLLRGRCPTKELVDRFRAGGGDGKLVQGGTKVCWGPDEAECVKTVHRLWPNEVLPGELAQVLPTPAHFEQATELVTEEMIAESVPCGPDVDRIVAAFQEFADAGFDELYVQQIGGRPRGVLRAAGAGRCCPGSAEAGVRGGPAGDLVGGHRPGDPEALRELAPERAQDRHRGVVLDALGDDLEPEPLAELDGRADDAAVRRVALEPGDEGAVDLQRRRPAAARGRRATSGRSRSRRRSAGSPSAREPLEHREAALGVAHRGRLGHLQLAACRWPEQRRRPRPTRSGCEHARRQVHRHRHAQARRPPTRCLVGGAAPSTHDVSGRISPVRSARSMNAPGGTRPWPGRCQRTSASKPASAPVRRSTFGW